MGVNDFRNSGNNPKHETEEEVLRDPECIRAASQGADAIAAWRQSNPDKVMRLFEAQLSGIDLSGANLSNANLQNADLSGANLVGSNLGRCILTGANLRSSNLSKAYLSEANLFSAFAEGANMREAYLQEAMLGGAYLKGSDFSDAHLQFADLHFAKLEGAKLCNSDLSYSVLYNTDMSNTDFTGATFAETSIESCDMSKCLGLSKVFHTGPSSIGIDTLVLSFRGSSKRTWPTLHRFFLNAGVPGELLAAIPQVMATVKYRSCFVCYGSPDEALAKKLVNALKQKGVSTWLYTLDATPGERTWGEIHRVRRKADKMILICSAHALVREGVLKEIETQIDDDPEKLIPISADDLWKERGFQVKRGDSDLKPFLMERNYVDFKHQRFADAINKLVRALRYSPTE